jgi:hypothetical protein
LLTHPPGKQQPGEVLHVDAALADYRRMVNSLRLAAR